MRALLLTPLAILALSTTLLHAEPAAPNPPAPPAPPVDFAHVPWLDGESLTYSVSWEGLEAAEGTFVAHHKGDHWEFNLSLGSRGMVDTVYPFTGNFWSILAQANPWRSVEYGEYRFEPKRVIKERTRIDYAAKTGTREMWVEGQSKTFPIGENAVDDVGTMLYHVRTGDWKPGDSRILGVYESSSEKQATITCEARETRAFGTWPAQPVLRIAMLPGAGTKKKGHLTMWMTDDARRLPLHAELEFRYGTFDLDLTQTGKTVPIGK